MDAYLWDQQEELARLVFLSIEPILTDVQSKFNLHIDTFWLLEWIEEADCVMKGMDKVVDILLSVVEIEASTCACIDP